MRNSFTSASASLIVLSSLIFTSGCQNESSVTKRSKPSRVSYTTPPKARALSVSEHLTLDQIATDALGPVGAEMVNWEEDVARDAKKSQKNNPPTLDEVLNFETSDLGSLGGDAEETDAFLDESSNR